MQIHLISTLSARRYIRPAKRLILNLSFIGFSLLNLASCAKGGETSSESESTNCDRGVLITFEANGATSGSTPATRCAPLYNSFYIGSNEGNLARVGFVFTGWNTHPSGIGTTYSGTYSAQSAGTLTLYAKWTVGYSLTYDGNGNTGGNPPAEPVFYLQGSGALVRANTGGLVKTGFAFAGWNTQANGSGTSYASGGSVTIGTANVTLYARWGTPYTVTYDGNGNTAGSPPVDADVYAAGNLFTVKANTGGMQKTGAEFLGWNTQADGSGSSYVDGQNTPMGSANVVLYAKWGYVNRFWRSVASSSDGVKFVAVANSSRIYTSADSGLTWTARESSRNWTSVASSADGAKLVATVSLGQVFTSADSGLSWVARDSARNWNAVASSADGTRIVAVASSSQIYTSADSGATWTARDSVRNWNAVTSSTDGTKLVATVSPGQIYTSADSGATWTARDSSRFWYAVASSADGTKLVAVVYLGRIYTSTDSGVTWTARDSNRNWYAVASSTDGVNLVAVANTDRIYTSSDSGLTWTQRDSSRAWNGVACSADGVKLVAGVSGGNLYTSGDSGLNWLAKY